MGLVDVGRQLLVRLPPLCVRTHPAQTQNVPSLPHVDVEVSVTVADVFLKVSLGERHKSPAKEAGMTKRSARPVPRSSPAARLDAALERLDEVRVAGDDDAELDQLRVVPHVVGLNMRLHVIVVGQPVAASGTLETDDIALLLFFRKIHFKTTT